MGKGDENMSKNLKTTFKVFDYMHCDDFARYLEEMATKGWHFKEWGIGLKFEKGEPLQVKYAVEVFTSASENDLRPEPNTQEFAEYCEAAGWKFIDAKQKFCIFKKIEAGAVEILTPEERVKNAFKATVSASYIILFVLYGLNAVLQWGNMLQFFSNHIFSVMSYFNIAVWSLAFLSFLIKLIYATIRRQKLLKKVKNGEPIYIGSNPNRKRRFDAAWMQWSLFLVLFLLMVLLLENTSLKIYFVLVFLVTLLFGTLLAKFRPDASTNIIIQIVFTMFFFIVIMVTSFTIFSEDSDYKNDMEKVPLLISDYRDFKGEIEDISIYQERSILGSSEIYFVFGEEESIHYEIYRSEHDWILDRIWKDELKPKYNQNRTDCTKDWDAELAFRNKIGEYYVRYDDALLILSDYEDIVLDEEQINVIREKLDLR